MVSVQPAGAAGRQAARKDTRPEGVDCCHCRSLTISGAMNILARFAVAAVFYALVPPAHMPNGTNR